MSDQPSDASPHPSTTDTTDTTATAKTAGVPTSDTSGAAAPQTAQTTKPTRRRGIFLCYRRSDSMAATGRIYERLARRYGKQRIFRDVDTLAGGADFARSIRETIPQSAVALVVMGRTWADARDEEGQRRLDDSEDFVRREVEAAFADAVPVVPVLVGGARMPEAEQLPPSLRRLPTRNAVVVNDDPDFEPGVRRLIKAVDPLLPPGMRPAVKRRRRAIFSAVSGVALLALLSVLLRPLLFPPPPGAPAPEPYGGGSTAGDTLAAVVSVPSGTAVDAWAVGSDAAGHGFVLHESGGRWAKVYPLGLAAQQHPIPSLLGLAMASPQEGWAVGVGGTMLHLAGGTWRTDTAPLTKLALSDVALTASGSEGWAVGMGGTMLHLTGGTWRAATSPTEDDLQGLALTASGSEGWAVGGAGTMLHLAGGTWSVFPMSFQYSLGQVVLTASGSEGWAVGLAGGTMLHLAGGTWSAVPLPTNAGPVRFDVQGVALTASGSEGWAVGGGGTMLHLAGGTWRTAESPTRFALSGVALSPSGSEGWAVGDFGTILHLAGGAWSIIN